MRIFNTQAELMSILSTLNLKEEGAAYIKYPRYVIGYRELGIQIIKGSAIYCGLRDIGAYIKSYASDEVDLPTNIHGYCFSDLPAGIETHLPSDLFGYLKAFPINTKDLPTYIYAWQYKDLNGFLNTMRKKDLQVLLNPIVPVDLPAYLKVWPQEDLPVYLRGWQYHDISSSLNVVFSNNLSVYIGTHPWVNLKSWLKGWVREVYSDIRSTVRSFTYEDMLVIIRATYLENISAYIYPIQPVDIQSIIHGFALADLGSILNGLNYPYNLTANITGTGNYTDLLSYIGAAISINNYKNLSGTLQCFSASDINSIIGCITAPNLTAYINAIGGSSDLSAYIYPKIIRLSTLLPISTLEHKNLSAVINASCKSSMAVDLIAYLRPVYMRNITSYVKGLAGAETARNLSVYTGYHDKKAYVDILPINISLPNNIYKEIDKFMLYIRVFNGLGSLPASITGIHITNDIRSSIVGTYIDDYNFKYSKNWERVYDLEYTGKVRGREDVEMSFKSVVNDYFFVDAETKVYKINNLDRWVVNVRSFSNIINRVKVKRKLHREKLLYDLKSFTDIDAAVRFVIDHVSYIPHGDLSSYIYTSSKCVNLGCSITPMYIVHTNSNINSSITGMQPTVIYTTNIDLNIL